MSTYGLGEVGFCDKGTLSTTKTDAFVLGYRSEAKLECNEESVSLYRGMEGRNLVNRKITGLKTFQPSMFMLKKVIQYAKEQCDIQAVTVPQSASADSEDVFQFTGNNILGIDFEYLISHQERSLMIAPEGQIEYEDHLTFMDAADSAAVADLGFTNEGKDDDKYKHPWFLSIQAPNGTNLGDRFNIKERKLSIKPVVERLQYNIPKSHFVEFLLEVLLENTSVAEVVTLMGKDMSPSILLKEKNNAAGTYYDGFDIDAGWLSQKITNHSIGDKQRDVKVQYKGQIPLYKVLGGFAFGDTNGGSAADTDGKEGTGGTLTIS